MPITKPSKNSLVHRRGKWVHRRLLEDFCISDESVLDKITRVQRVSRRPMNDGKSEEIFDMDGFMRQLHELTPDIAS
jgi:hypothetical protein